MSFVSCSYSTLLRIIVPYKWTGQRRGWTLRPDFLIFVDEGSDEEVEEERGLRSAVEV